MSVFVIERQFGQAAAFALAGSLLTFFGFIHGEEIGVAQSPVVALGYLGVAAMLFGFARYAHVAPAEPSDIDPHNVSVQATE
jgi:adenine/guanine/hypoxanthine permease